MGAVPDASTGEAARARNAAAGFGQASAGTDGSTGACIATAAAACTRRGRASRASIATAARTRRGHASRAGIATAARTWRLAASDARAGPEVRPA